MADKGARWTTLRSTLKKRSHLVDSYYVLKNDVVQALLMKPGTRTSTQLEAILAYFRLVCYDYR